MPNIPKGIIYMGIAVVSGLLATFGIQRYVAHKTYVAPVSTGQVAVATADISPGIALAAGSVKIVSWPRELVPPQSASALQQVEGRVAVMQISTGEPVLFSKLAPLGTEAGLSGLLDANKRALAVRVDDVSGVAGFVHPRDKVDVLVDMKIHDMNDSFSKTILQNITVLTIGQTWEQKENKPIVVNTVTLEVTPEQAEILNLASSEGKIRLALRSRRNETIVETRGVATSQLFTGVVKKQESPKVQPQKEERTVEVIKGLERTKTTL
ncbi:MAG: Flp pilus assembly protein CpaB [Deltaproteobacteria bacterium]|nr:Flp pilus assembly protein CpaB [Deltaproteobacteria bacterium]